jgi:hypothetical protein
VANFAVLCKMFSKEKTPFFKRIARNFLKFQKNSK